MCIRDSPYTDIAKSSIYYQQVKELSLLYAKTARPDHPAFVYYETYFMEHGFYQYHDKNLLSASVHPAITRIMEYDRTANTEYARTLQMCIRDRYTHVSAAIRFCSPSVSTSPPLSVNSSTFV